MDAAGDLTRSKEAWDDLAARPEHTRMVVDLETTHGVM
jgi:hypothetical protein